LLQNLGVGCGRDVSDVMQFVHLGGHSGTLHLERGHERASIGFHHGRIVSAGTADSKRVGELLCEAEALSAEALSQALDQQHKTVPRQSLGRILIERGFVSEDQMRRAMESQVQKSVLDLTTWSHGSFEFVLNEMEPVDDISFYPGDFVPLVDLNTQLVLLEAARIFDERSHRAPAGEAREAAPEEARSETQPEASSRDGVPYVQVVSSDDLLAERPRHVLANNAGSNVGSPAGSERNDQCNRSRRIALRPDSLRHRRERGSGGGQMQKSSAGKFHF